MGRGGFPTLLFMDAAGKRVASPRDRRVASFASCLNALTTIDAVRTRADAGDTSAAIEFLLLEVELRRVKGPAFTKRAATLQAEADEGQVAALARAQLDFRIGALVRRSYGGEKEAVGIEILKMLREGKIPRAGSPTQAQFWYLAHPLVRASGDAPLIRAAAKQLRADFGPDDQQSALAPKLEALAKGLDERSVLTARVRAGETGLEAKVLLLELKISAITAKACKGRMAAALAVATKEEAIELRQRAVDLEVHDLVVAFWSGHDRAVAGARLVELYGAGTPTPSQDVTRLAMGPLGIQLGGKRNQEQRERFVEKLRTRVEGAPYLQRVIDMLSRKR